jgi:hypothetical protein
MRLFVEAENTKPDYIGHHNGKDETNPNEFFPSFVARALDIVAKQPGVFLYFVRGPFDWLVFLL